MRAFVFIPPNYAETLHEAQPIIFLLLTFKIMSRNKYTNECSVPHQRGRKQILKGKRLSNKRVRSMPIDTDEVTLKRLQKSVELDKDPPNNFNCL